MRNGTHTLAALAMMLAMAAAGATPFMTISPQAPQAGRSMFVRLFPQWGASEVVAPVLFVVPQGQPLTSAIVTYATGGPPATTWTTFELALPAGVYDLRYYASPQPGSGQPADLVSTIVVTPTGPIPVVEYYNPIRDHYFVTSDPEEMRALDTGSTPGWIRTGEHFYAVDGRATLFVRPVCRLYGLPSAGIDSHFLSDDPKECVGALQRWPDSWVKETDAAFALPVDNAPGCDTDEYARLYRLFNNRTDVNHRYTTSVATARKMVAAGWIVEGSYPHPGADLPYWSCALSGWLPGR